MNRACVLCLCVVVVLYGCAIGPSAPAAVAIYDLGIEPAVSPPVRVGGHVALTDVAASPWLQSSAIMYRLTYQEAQQLNPYSRSRWAATPAALVGQRLRLVLAQAAAAGATSVVAAKEGRLVLRIDLDAFEQLVDSPQAARAIVRMRASLHNGTDRRPRAQRMIAVERASPSVDAQGAVRALSAATDASIAELVEWLSREVNTPH